MLATASLIHPKPIFTFQRYAFFDNLFEMAENGGGSGTGFYRHLGLRSTDYRSSSFRTDEDSPTPRFGSSKEAIESGSDFDGGGGGAGGVTEGHEIAKGEVPSVDDTEKLRRKKKTRPPVKFFLVTSDGEESLSDADKKNKSRRKKWKWCHLTTFLLSARGTLVHGRR